MSGVCVITDSISKDFYFPLWHSYYGRLFGEKNLFVVTYENNANHFGDYELGGVWSCGFYDDTMRAKMISDLTSTLLRRYKHVVRVDTDEFLVPDPRKYADLASYIESLHRPYVTAYGYDVIQGSEEQTLRLKEPVLVRQRRYAYPYDALSKTCITCIPIHWAPGFHFGSVAPEFNDVYLFHLKRADIDLQLAIGKAVASRAAKGTAQIYHSAPREQFLAHNESALRAPRGMGWSFFTRTKYQGEFLTHIRYITSFGGIYQGRDFAPERILTLIPDDFADYF